MFCQQREVSESGHQSVTITYPSDNTPALLGKRQLPRVTQVVQTVHHVQVERPCRLRDLTVAGLDLLEADHKLRHCARTCREAMPDGNGSVAARVIGARSTYHMSVDFSCHHSTPSSGRNERNHRVRAALTETAVAYCTVCTVSAQAKRQASEAHLPAFEAEFFFSTLLCEVLRDLPRRVSVDSSRVEARGAPHVVSQVRSDDPGTGRMSHGCRTETGSHGHHLC